MPSKVFTVTMRATSFPDSESRTMIAGGLRVPTNNRCFTSSTAKDTVREPPATVQVCMIVCVLRSSTSTWLFSGITTNTRGLSLTRMAPGCASVCTPNTLLPLIASMSASSP